MREAVSDKSESLEENLNKHEMGFDDTPKTDSMKQMTNQQVSRSGRTYKPNVRFRDYVMNNKV